MIFKTKHIASQFLVQSLLTILVIGLLVVLFLFSSHQKEKINKTIRISENVSVQVKNLGHYLQIALYQQKSESDFVQVKSDKLINDHKQLINGLIDTLNQLHEINYLNKSLDGNLTLDSLVAQLKNYDHNYELCLYSLKEKGNRFGGIIGQINTLAGQMVKGLRTAPDSGKKEMEFIDISTNFFNTYNFGDLQSMKELCDGISSAFYEYDGFDTYKIEKIADNLVAQSRNFENIEKRLNGELQYEGQIKAVEEALNQCFQMNNKLYNEIEDRNQSYLFGWNIVILIISLILLGVVVYSIFQLSNITKNSVKKVLSTSEALTLGDFKQALAEENNVEFESISKNFKLHNNHLDNRTSFINEIFEDKLDREIEILSKKDYLGIALDQLKNKLLKVQKEQEERAKENEIRRYINEGLAKFADIMRVNSNDTIALGDSLVKNLTKYLNALQGTIFLNGEKSNDELQLISAFAYDRKKYMSKKIKFGEGLIGTCANEKKTIYLKKVPDDYAIITSGLGDAPPNKVLIVPVMHENDLVGVIELASLYELKPYEIELTEQIASSLASTIITVRNNTRTAQLLEKSQQQAAEMAEQEEEMRQNMEELKATQEESARREEEMQGVIDAIGNSFYILEYDSKGKIVNANDRIIKFLEQPYVSIIGKTHEEILSTTSVLNKDFFADIVNNKKNEKVSEILNWGSKKYNYTYSISPIVSRYDEVIKILNLISIEEVKEQY